MQQERQQQADAKHAIALREYRHSLSGVHPSSTITGKTGEAAQTGMSCEAYDRHLIDIGPDLYLAGRPELAIVATLRGGTGNLRDS